MVEREKQTQKYARSIDLGEKLNLSLGGIDDSTGFIVLHIVPVNLSQYARPTRFNSLEIAD